ncbi:nucleotide-diphospho-sugar transferase [Cladochytrium replicatum]|nr:nucleotide-diphospho-sugar transferase [Cladochytrium replicatum]
MSARLAALVLAAGYGSRLQRDIRNDPENSHEHLLGVPKALLPIAGRSILDHWIHHLGALPSFNPQSDFFLVTNDAFHELFASWATHRFGSAFVDSNIFNDHSTSNETRLGACVDMALAIEQLGIWKNYDGVLVIAGDTLFLADFEINEFLKMAWENTKAGCVVAAYTVSDADTKKVGVMETTVDDVGNEKVTGLVEKPGPDATTSRLACPCFYLLKSEGMAKLLEFVEEHKSLGLEAVDASGLFVAWLVQRCPTYALRISGRLDIGGLDSLRDAEAYLSQHHPK